MLLCNKDGWNALHIAARAGSVDMLNFLYKVQSSCLKTTSKNARTPLHSAALNGCEEALEWILNKGIKPDMVDSCGVTPLMDGARMGHVRVCEMLVSKGADILHLDNLERTVLHHITQAGQINMIQWCVEKATEKITKNPSQGKKASKKRKFLSRCNSLHLEEMNSNNSLMRSCSLNNPPRRVPVSKKPSFLVNTGVRDTVKGPEEVEPVPTEDQFINWKSLQGSTALHYAAKESRYLVIRALLKMGANKAIPDNFGRIPIEMTTSDNVHVLLE